MNNRLKNICILAILILFLLVVELIPVTCIFKDVTGIFCPACGMTRAFYAILQFDFYSAFSLNILSIPLFICICLFVFALIYEIIFNKFIVVPKILKTLSNKIVMCSIFILLFLSFLINNL